MAKPTRAQMLDELQQLAAEVYGEADFYDLSQVYEPITELSNLESNIVANYREYSEDDPTSRFNLATDLVRHKFDPEEVVIRSWVFASDDPRIVLCQDLAPVLKKMHTMLTRTPDTVIFVGPEKDVLVHPRKTTRAELQRVLVQLKKKQQAMHAEVDQQKAAARREIVRQKVLKRLDDLGWERGLKLLGDETE